MRLKLLVVLGWLVAAVACAGGDGDEGAGGGRTSTDDDDAGPGSSASSSSGGGAGGASSSGSAGGGPGGGSPGDGSIVLATSSTRLGAVALADGDVLFADAGRVKRVSQTGGSVDVVVSTNLGTIRDVEVDGAHAFICSAQGVWTVAIAGGAATQLSGAACEVGGIALSPTDVYFAGLHAVLQVPREGGGTSVAANLSFPADLATDGTHLYVLDNTNFETTLQRRAFAGGTLEVLIEFAASDPTRLDIHGNELLIGGGFEGLHTLATNGGALAGVTLGVPLSSVEELLHGGEYGVLSFAQSLIRFPFSGTGGTFIAYSGAVSENAMATDGADVYWTTFDDPSYSLRRVPVTNALPPPP